MLFKKKLLPRIIFLLSGLVMILSLLLVKKSGFLRIQNIEVKTDFQFQNQKKIEQIFKPYLGKPFFFNDNEKLIKEVKNQEIKIAEVKVRKEFPGKIILEIKKRQPILAIPADNLYFWLDSKGIIFSLEKEAKDLPLLAIELQKIEIGSRIEIERIKIPQILAILKQEGIRKITVLADQVQLETGQLGLIILPKEAIEKKIGALQIILNRFRIEGKRLTKIDLRFEKPVVSF